MFYIPGDYLKYRTYYYHWHGHLRLLCVFDLVSKGYEVEIYEKTDTFGGQVKA
jgi:hypothetical protein